MADEKTYTFAKTVKSELAFLDYDSKIMRFGVLSGFTRLNGNFSLGKVPSISYKTEIAAVAKLIYSLLKEMYGVTPRVIYERKMRFDKSMVYIIKVETPKAFDILQDLKVMKNLKLMPLRSLINEENLKYFLVGCFLATGSVNSPSSKSYFLEMAFAEEDDANRVKEALLGLGEFTVKVIQRRDKWIVYLKRSSEIAVFLSFLGSTNSMLNYENVRATKDLMNNENRLDICAAYNYSRSLKTGKQNLEDIHHLLSIHSLSFFDPKTQAVIKARLEHHDASFGELADIVSANGIQISKSGISHVFSMLHEMSKQG